MHARRLPLSPLPSTRRPARRAGRRALSAGVAQLAEHLFCKQVVGGSSPPASSIFCVIPGGLPERPKGAGCKPAGIAYVGSNPTPSTRSGYVSVVPAGTIGPQKTLNKKTALRSGGTSITTPAPRLVAGVAQLVEHQPSKLNVEGSNPFSRSTARQARRIGWPT